MTSLQELDRRVRCWSQSRRRAREIAAQLPETIDLFVLVMQAGLDFQVALAQYLERAPQGALSGELSKLQAEIRTGTPRVEALRHLLTRTSEPGLQETVRTIIQGIELGASLAPLLKRQAQALRQRRASEAEKRAAVAPLKLLVPLLMFIFPTILVVIFAPMYLSLAGGGGLP